MAELASEDDIHSIPKVELHVHLNGSIAEETAAVLARRHGADPQAALILADDGRYPGRYPDFEGFLATYLAANQFVRTPDDLELVAAAFSRAQAAQRVVYSEAIFTAMIYARNGMDQAEMGAALRRGFAAAPGTRITLNIDTIRDLGPEEAAATVAFVEASDAPIVGLCLTGIEGTVPVEAFIPFRRAARTLGLGFEVHAGEMGPPQSVIDSLDILAADRIGHGVAAIREPALLRRLVREQVVLDVCPSSNVAIGAFPSLEAHPMTDFWRAGVAMTISSDDPPFFRTTLTDELRHLVRIARLTRADLAELQRRAMRASFAPPATKAEVIAEIDAWEADG
jgi:adenosine deaminase